MPLNRSYANHVMFVY